MIAFIILVVGGMLLVGVGAVGIMLYRRTKRMQLAAEHRCLVCESSNLEALAAPDTRCLDCGFDSSRAHQVAEQLDQLRLVRLAIHAFEEGGGFVGRANVLKFAGPDMAEDDRRQAQRSLLAAHSHLNSLISGAPGFRDIPVLVSSGDTLSLANLVAEDADEGAAVSIGDLGDEVEEYLEVVRALEARVCRDIRAALQTDGSAKPVVHGIDFEHVVTDDYRDL